MKIVHQHLNRPQMLSGMIMAPEEWNVLARGTGKTVGILAPKTAKLMDSMPRSTGVIVATTFQQLLTRTLKPLVQGWERMGYRRGVHFLVGEKPTKQWIEKWNWLGPYQPPFDFSNFICWYNGAGAQFVSQDRVGSSNGISIDWIAGDEAKLLNEQRLKEELFPANRGIIKDFIDNPQHHGKTFTTDMPVGTAGRWILNKKEEMNMDQYASILKVLARIYELNQQLNASKNKTHIQAIAKQIAYGEQMLNLLRRNFVFYQEASALENIDALGIDYFKEELRSLSKFQFETAILNIRPYKLEDGFYPTLNEEKHGYFSYDYHHYNQIGYDFDKLQEFDDCRKDGDLIQHQSLHLAIDYNKSIWPFVTGQVTHNLENNCKELRVLKGLHVKHPLGLSDALDKWDAYYTPHKHKVVYFWYDHTALNETRPETNKDLIVDGLRARGWTVIECFIGKTVNQDIRYSYIHDLFGENNKYNWVVRINRDNCKYLLLSMFQAQSVEKSKGFGKDKRTEHDPKFPQEEATHYSDAFDTLAFGVVFSGINYEQNHHLITGIFTV